MKIFRVEAMGDVMYIQAKDILDAKKQLKLSCGDIPDRMLEWNEVDSKPDDEEFL